MGEVAQERSAPWGMDDLRMKLNAVVTTFVVRDGGKLRPVTDGDGPKSFGEPGDPVAVAHPHLFSIAGRPQPIEQVAAIRDFDERASEFAMVSGLHFATELSDHGLLAVTDPEDRDAELERQSGSPWRIRPPARMQGRPKG